MVDRTQAALAAFLALFAASTARADDFPTRKPGLWEIATTIAGTPRTSRLCVDAASEAAMIKKGVATRKDVCTRQEIHRSGNVLTDDSVCRPMSSEVTAHSVTTFTGDTAYSTVVTARYNPPFMGKTDTTTTQEAKWLGPCGADMKPGDMLVNGRIVHIGP